MLADRGFTIQESVAFHGATLDIPAFTKMKKQLLPTDIECTRKIANVRIHVERVIRVIRGKYSILKSTIPITLLQSDENGYTTSDKIVQVSCILSDCSESIVPFD